MSVLGLSLWEGMSEVKGTVDYNYELEKKFWKGEQK